MVRSCYLCKKKTIKNDNISLHKFPKDRRICKKWVDACGLSDVDDISHLYICSCHFRDEDVGRMFPHEKPKLIPGSIPSISVPNPIIFIVHKSDKLAPREIESSIPDVASSERAAQKTHFVERRSGNNENENLLQVKVTTPSTLENKVIIEDVVEGHLSVENVDLNNSPSLAKCSATPRKRRFAEPRFVSEICTLDVATPKKAQKIINFVKRMDEKKSKRIKVLQDKNRKLIKRINSLENIISHLQDKQLLSQESGDTLIVQYTNELKENPIVL